MNENENENENEDINKDKEKEEREEREKDIEENIQHKIEKKIERKEDQLNNEEQSEDDSPAPLQLKQKYKQSSPSASSSSSSSFNSNNFPTFPKSSSPFFSSISSFLLEVKDTLKVVCSDFTFSNLIHIFVTFKKSFMILFLAQSTWTMGIFYLMIGLIFAFTNELFHRGPKYNIIILLIIIASIAFSKFPQNSIRPQIVITILFSLSLILDIQSFARSPKIVSAVSKAFTACTILAKLLAIYDFLWFSSGATRARKYLIRRVRVFLIPFTRPRRIMREIRARILALEWIQFVAMIAYFTLFIASISTAGFSNIMVSPQQGIPLFAFFPIKSFFSAVIFFAFVADTDMILCLSYFGCLGWNMSYVKVYIHKKREAHGGWPLSYGLNPYRFYGICALKVFDFCWGIGGWVTLGTTFNQNLNQNVIAIISPTIVMLVLTDIWCPILFYIVYDLLNLHKREVEYHEKNNEIIESDDSELDEFNIRDDKKAIAKARKTKSRKMSRVRVDSGENNYDDEGDENSVGSDSPSLKRNKPISKNNSQRHKSNEIHHSDDRDSIETGYLHYPHITLEMALGSPGDDDDDDDDDNDDNDDDKYSSKRNNNQLNNKNRRSQVNNSNYNNKNNNNNNSSLLQTPPRNSQFVSPRQQYDNNNSNNNNSNNSTPIQSSNLYSFSSQYSPSPIKTTYFSPGQGDWSKATSNAASFPQRPNIRQNMISSPIPMKSLPPRHIIPSSPYQQWNNEDDEPNNYPQMSSQFNINNNMDINYNMNSNVINDNDNEKYDNYNNNNLYTIVVDELTSITPEYFTELWNNLPVAITFSSFLQNENVTIESKLTDTIQHFTNNLFYIVAAGQIETTVTIYGFVSGNKIFQDQNQNVNFYFLFEFKLDFSNIWKFECVCKCTESDVTGFIIRRMLLGDIFQQINSHDNTQQNFE